MKTKMKMKTLSIVAALTTVAAVISSSHAWGGPLACADLQLEQKLITKGVKHYTLSVVESRVSDAGKKVVGTCAAGTKKILYSKNSESIVSNTAAQTAVQAAKDAAFHKVSANSAANEITVTKNVDYENKSTAALIASLHALHNTNLYYSYDDMPGNIKALMSRPGIVTELVDELAREENEYLVRFNLALILNHKLRGDELNDAERDAINAVLAKRLNDQSAWVRTEAVWGLRFAPDSQYEGAVSALVSDRNEYVSNEARDTLDHIRYHKAQLVAKNDLNADPWERTEKIWGLTFSPDFAYDIQIRPELAGDDNGIYARTTVTEIRYKN
jgi:Protein of unknown function (DUF1161)